MSVVTDFPRTAAGADPADYTARQVYDAISAAFGPGANGPLTIVVSLARPGAPAAQENTLRHALATTAGVASVSPDTASPDGAILHANIIPRSSPQDAATGTLQTTLRAALAGTGSRGYVIGSTSERLDFRNQISGRLPVLALKGAALNLLSIGAAYGVIVAVFQWRWGGTALGVSGKVPIESYVPMMMVAIVFGLSMDYEVFLLSLSRIREAWLRTGDNHASVAAGLAATARVISCAALIMASVFLSFLLSANVVVKMLALGLGVSVLIDASVIRLLIVPATMFLLGRLNWWLPARPDPALPRLDPESARPEPARPRQPACPG